MKALNVRVWLPILTVFVFLVNLLPILSPETVATDGWGDALTGNELNTASTYEGAFGISSIMFVVFLLLIISLLVAVRKPSSA